ncbi:hypothetical protein BBOV_I000730 [Babesia bovis T2Bo]|uniref:Uncharacterized protein n=1 Tax=Babesia bovis TaxID=5865 RepID=A7AX94_BABBO|nr:hypothetical protein BBOV_I000730 [Babesia bovis T2Bo]EDO05167.1 hypothetical protein BBOV_I000730 [Babesia bovis T2Bo]|eukprot:XP_001608735.1 hypothetical protein [Babesia bovis T2Bo]
MSISLETSAGYIDSEYSDFEHAYSVSNVSRTSPKFGRDGMQWNYNRNVFSNFEPASVRQDQSTIKTLEHIDVNAYNRLNQPVRPLNTDDYDTATDTDAYYEDSRKGFVNDESYKYDRSGNDFKWWCDEQEASDFSIANTGEDVTPIKLDDSTPIEDSKLLSQFKAVQSCGQLTERTQCGSSISDDWDDNVSIASRVSTKEAPVMPREDEWSSFMKPADQSEELDLLKQQIMQRLGFKIANMEVHKKVSKRSVESFEAATQTNDDSFGYDYRERESAWLREVNELLATKFVDIVSNGKLMAYKTEQRFIEALQAHLNRSQNEIDRLMHLKNEVVQDQQYDELIRELDDLKAQNSRLQEDVDELNSQLEELQHVAPVAERARKLEQKLREEKASKKALMDDFTKTLGYMRLMKDRLKTLSGDKQLPKEPERNEVPPKPRNNTQPTPLKGCIKRSNTTSCTPVKQDRVKFAETSDVYYLPKRSNSELGPYVADMKKQMPILPCKIRPQKQKSQQSGGLMGFFRNIKQTFTNNSRHSSPNANVLKVPTKQDSQTQRQLEMYRQHLHSRGLV